MNCPRCQGLLHREYVSDWEIHGCSIPCWRCINCGHRNDLIYDLNRRRQREEQKEVAHGV